MFSEIAKHFVAVNSNCSNVVSIKEDPTFEKVGTPRAHLYACAK